MLRKASNFLWWLQGAAFFGVLLLLFIFRRDKN